MSISNSKYLQHETIDYEVLNNQILTNEISSNLQTNSSDFLLTYAGYASGFDDKTACVNVLKGNRINFIYICFKRLVIQNKQALREYDTYEIYKKAETDDRDNVQPYRLHRHRMITWKV